MGLFGALFGNSQIEKTILDLYLKLDKNNMGYVPSHTVNGCNLEDGKRFFINNGHLNYMEAGQSGSFTCDFDALSNYNKIIGGVIIRRKSYFVMMEEYYAPTLLVKNKLNIKLYSIDTTGSLSDRMQRAKSMFIGFNYNSEMDEKNFKALI